MRIKKVSQTAGLVGSVVNTQSESNKDTYSCDYINGLNTYSTTEQIVGKWIDNRLIYRKVYTFTTGSNNSDFTIGALPTNISSVVRASAIIGTPTQGIIAPNSWDNTYGVGIAWFNGNIVGRLNFSSYANKDGILIFEYTKTTD